jgi:LuxR family maltose regulon positive regulatory protein
MSEEVAVKEEESKLAFELSARELEILKMLPSQRTAKMMGVAMNISHRTVQFHMDNLYWKLGVSGQGARDRAIRKGRSMGLID